MTFSDNEILEIRRMLAAFKEDLPAHELGGWYVTSQPDETVIEDERNVFSVATFRMEEGRIIAGYATCQRCGKRFEIPRIGNFRTWEGRLQETITEAKEWVEREAKNDGPCWGDVPSVKERNHEALAVLDRA